MRGSFQPCYSVFVWFCINMFQVLLKIDPVTEEIQPNASNNASFVGDCVIISSLGKESAQMELKGA